MMTKVAVARFAKDERNCLVHLSSILGYMPLPFYDVYSGTKIFNRVFGGLVHATKSGNTPDTLIVSPGKTTTPMTHYAKDGTTVDPEEVVFGMCRELGHRTYAEVNGAFWHNVQGGFSMYFPQVVYHKMRKDFGKKEEFPFK